MSHDSHAAEVKDREESPPTTFGDDVPKGANPPTVVNTEPYAPALGGVVRVEALQRVWGKYSKWALWIGVALSAYMYSLDGTTAWQYQAYATSSFSAHSLLGAVSTAQAIIIAVTKPIAGKIADTWGRAEAFTLCVLFYVVGYIGINTYAGGAIIYEFGYASLQILVQIIIGDVTNLRWRGLVSSSVSIPFFVNAFVSSNIAQGILNGGSNWRWGYGMLIILIPATLAPIIVTLYWAQHRAKKLGLIATDYVDSDIPTPKAVARSRPSVRKVYNWFVEMDAPGLLLFAAGWSCLLLPLTLVNGNHLTWNSGKIIAMLVVGPIILIFFVFYEAKLAITPLFPLHFFKNKTIVAAALIGFFDFVSFYLQYTYQYSFIYVTHPTWSIKNQGYFAYIQTLMLTLAALMAGVYQLYFRRTKWLLTGGLCIRLLGVGLMIKSKGAHGSTAFLVWTQIIQGLGGGIASCSCQLLAQASVPHAALSTVTALVLLFAEIGNAVGSAISAAIWRQHMPGQLEQHLSGLLPQANITAIYGSITSAVTYADNVPVFEGIIASYDYTMKVLLIAATCIAIIPIFLSLMVTDIFLSDAQNAVEKQDVAGRALDGKILDSEKS